MSLFIDIPRSSAEELLREPHVCTLALLAPGNVLKVKHNNVERRGTVKELWTQGDYEISISGVLISNKNNELPEDDLKKLRAYCEHRGAIEVYSPLFTIFNITKICIESYDFPFTKGMENQMFSIKAVSDDFETSNLLIAK